jgi:hypothetical protein
MRSSWWLQSAPCGVVWQRPVEGAVAGQPLAPVQPGVLVEPVEAGLGRLGQAKPFFLNFVAKLNRN